MTHLVFIENSQPSSFACCSALGELWPSSVWIQNDDRIRMGFPNHSVACEKFHRVSIKLFPQRLPFVGLL
jgi:hypothetical protein